MRENRIRIRTEEQGKPLGDLFGIFFEDLNHGADGGLYAELVQNRSFEFAEIDNPAYHGLTAWERIGAEGKVELTVKEGDAVSARNPHYLHMELLEAGSGAGVRNRGFGSGMYLQRGAKYRFSCYARCAEGACCRIKVSLRDGEDECLAEGAFSPNREWGKYGLVLEIPKMECGMMGCGMDGEERGGGADSVAGAERGGGTDSAAGAGSGAKPGGISGGSLALTFTQGECVELDLVSLFPEKTYRGRENGLRADLAEALAELTPRFMRFPGGCLVHDGSLDADARDSLYRWKNTIGPLEERPARRSNWGYNQTLGLGYYEYFLLCEDIGTKPVPILPAAYDPHHKRMAPIEELGPWIQEALDLIEFANGDEATPWGAVRAKLGHPAPFGLEYLGIGNEEVGEGFRERFPYFVRAIRESYPEMKIIGSSGPFSAGGEYDLGWECARENGADIVDEHYYMAPEWFIANVHRYDHFPAQPPYVFLGEYASCGNRGGNALAEAAFMTGLQNACQGVKMACYAPLLCHREYVNWRPDLIWFDNGQVCRTVNYQVQKLFMNHQGDELLPCVLETELECQVLADVDSRKRGAVYLWGNGARVAFTEILLTDTDTGREERYSDREALADRVPVLLTQRAPENFILRFRAKELEGKNGFRLYFGWRDEGNRLGWVLGGWENQDAALVEEMGGKSCFLTQSQFQVVSGKEYELELRVSGDRIEGWIDGELYQWTRLQPLEIEPLYLTASREEKSGDVILKAVNLRQEGFEAEVALPKLAGEELVCRSYALLEEDCAESAAFPEVETGKVRQHAETLRLSGTGGFPHEFPARSLTVLRLSRGLGQA